MDAPEPVSVTRLVTALRRNLEPAFRGVAVQGEMSGLNRASGSLYFTLKDNRSQLQCRLDRSGARKLSFTPENGLQVVAEGDVTIFGARGQLQLELRALRLDGLGQLFAALERLRAKLSEEGLFEATRKRPLPYLPRRVGVVTSLQGAVLHDIVTTLTRRNPAVEIIVSPAPVQGAEAHVKLVDALRQLHRVPRIDCVILARGGGSLEDLMPFNHEDLLRAVAKCRWPVISAVGHETDTTLCDLVADHRAATPTAAAERVAPVLADLQAELQELRQRMAWALQHRAERQRQWLEQLAGRAPLRFPYRRLAQEQERLGLLVARLHLGLRRQVEGQRQQWRELKARLALPRPEPERDRWEQLRARLQLALRHQVASQRQQWSNLQARLTPPSVPAEQERLEQLRERMKLALPRQVEAQRQQWRELAARVAAPRTEGERERLAQLNARLPGALQSALRSRRQELGYLKGKLEALSPLSVLDRGYALCLDEAGLPISSVAGRTSGDHVEVRLGDGSLHCGVEAVQPNQSEPPRGEPIQPVASGKELP